MVSVGEVGGHAENSPGSFSVQPSHARLVGNLARLQLQGTGTDDRGRSLDLTRGVSYSISDPGVASVSKTGAVVPLATGTGKIRVRHGGRTVEIPVTVSDFLPQAEVSFTRDVMPVLSRSGCNQGTCHGAQFGKGGFKLSLLGFAPERDYAPIVRDELRRRVSLLKPEDSLILNKAMLEIGHGGGRRFRHGSYDHQVLVAWLNAGVPAPIADDPVVVGLSLEPKERNYRVDQGQQLRVVARYSDNTTRDVTRTARYDALNEGVATVTEGGYVTAV